MAIVGHHPESGVRVVLERPRAEGPPWRYEGRASTQADSFPLVATLDTQGTVAVDLPTEAPTGLADKVRLIVRAAWRHAVEDQSPPPQRLSRWRADREGQSTNRGGPPC
jgi:hypothetical protein